MANEFNRTFFNRVNLISRIDAAYDMAASMNAAFAPGVKVMIEYQASAEMTASAEMGYCYIEAFNFSASMDGSAVAVPAYYLSWNLASSMDLDAAVVLKISPEFSFAAQMDGRFFPFARYLPSGLFASDMTADFNALQIIEKYMAFPSINIPARGTVIVDGNGFNVTLNGANALDKYEGEWLDIGRNFVGLDVSSLTSGNITVTVRYQEMFL